MRKLVAKIIAPIIAMTALFFFLFFPIFLSRFLNGTPMLENEMTGGEGWLLVIGGGIGAGAARLLQILVLSRFGKLDMDEIDRNWYGRRK
jgi:hypothetical protein